LKNGNKGITLIVLVITIIVLLILAAVSISTLTGENGLLKKASLAKEKNHEATVSEQLDIIGIEWISEKKTEQNASIDDFLQSKKEKGEIDNFKDNEDGTYTITKDGYERMIEDSKTEYHTISKVYEDRTTTQKVKAGDNSGKITHEEKDGFYFIDWSTNPSTGDFTKFKKTERADFSNVFEDMNVYPKYMSNEYLKVNFLPFVDNQGNPKKLFIISAVDNIVFKELGFDYWVDGNKKKYDASHKVATTFSLQNETTIYTYKASDKFEVSDGYIVYMDFNDDNSLELSEDTEIKIIPYFIRLDDTKIIGTEKIVRFGDLY